MESGNAVKAPAGSGERQGDGTSSRGHSLPAGSSRFKPVCLLDQNHSASKVVSLFFSPMRKKGARGFTGEFW